jgi:enoyl-CoA hydratase/carnithine racemase
MSAQKMISEPTAGDGTVPAAEPAVERWLDGKVAVLTMRHRPHNLLDPALSGYIIDAMAWAGTSGARAVLLRSGLRHFSAGADLDQMLVAADEGEGVLGWPLLETLRALEDLPLPIVAAVHGMCLGGGLELALACDLTVAGESAKIGCVEASVGLHPLMGAIQRIAQRAGVARAKEMAMLGRRYDARTLERWGIFNRVVADESLEAASLALARELAGGPTIANAATKKLANVAVNEGVRAADEAMAELHRPILTSADFRTGASSIKVNGPGMARFEGR